MPDMKFPSFVPVEWMGIWSVPGKFDSGGKDRVVCPVEDRILAKLVDAGRGQAVAPKLGF